MKFIKQLVTLATVALAGNAYAADAEAPDVLIHRLGQEVIDIAKPDKAIQAGDQKRTLDLVKAKILPYVDFQRATALTAGRFWRHATPEQKTQLTEQFRSLLIFTYSGALQQIRDYKLEVQPRHSDPSDMEVEVHSQVIRPGDAPVLLNYRMEKTPDWKLYDLSVTGAWTVETYKAEFASEIGKGGFDGLIKTLVHKNMQMANHI